MAKNKGTPGRPPIYETPEALQKKIDEYFEKGLTVRKVTIGAPSNRKVISIRVPTITGLVLYCGYCDRQSFYDVEKREGFSCTIKNARTRIEQEYEEALQAGLGAGAIFALKNFGWVDKQELEHSGHLNMIDQAIQKAKQCKQ